MKKFVAIFLFTSPLFSFSQDCKKFILTTEYKDVQSSYESAISAMRSSSFLSSSHRLFFEGIFKQKFYPSNLTLYLKSGSKLTAKLKVEGTEHVSVMSSVELIKPNLYFLHFPEQEKGFFILDLNLNIAVSYPDLLKFSVYETVCEF